MPVHIDFKKLAMIKAPFERAEVMSSDWVDAAFTRIVDSPNDQRQVSTRTQVEEHEK